MTKLLGIAHASRLSGKTLLAEKMIDEYLKRNPEATIIRYRRGQLIIEKPVKQVARKMIEHKP